MNDDSTIEQLAKELDITIENNIEVVNCDDTTLREAYYKLKDQNINITEDFYKYIRNEFLSYLSKQLDPYVQYAYTYPEKFVFNSKQYYERENKNQEEEPYWGYIQSDIEMYQYVYSDYVDKEEKLSILHTPNQPLEIKYIDNETNKGKEYTKRDFTELELIAYEILQRDKKRNEEYIQMLDNTLSIEDPLSVFRTMAKEKYCK